MSSGSKKKESRYAFSFSQKVPLNEPPPGSPSGAPMERAALNRAFFYISLKFPIKIPLNMENFPFSQRP
jgi:hypothetical protein